MPITPFHLGPALLIGLILLRYLDFPTFLIANIIVDIEPILVLFFRLDYPLHGFFHSFLGGSIAAVLLTVVMSKIRKPISPLISFFKIEQEISFKKILAASLIGVVIHILLDSPIYTDIQPLFPLEINPFYRSSGAPGLTETLICVYCFMGAFIVYLIILLKTQRKKPENNLNDLGNKKFNLS